MQGRVPDAPFHLLLPGSRSLAVVLAACAVPSCETAAGRKQASLWEPAGSVKRHEAIAIADSYVRHRWRPTALNVFHGRDENGIRVDTPDAHYDAGAGGGGWWQPGKINTGLPYKWGGFDTPEQFDAALKRGLMAGDVYSDEKRALDNEAVSDLCAGIDCSGFISRCWRLSAPFSTHEISKICDPLPDFDQLRPGDAVNKESEHILLFAGVAKDHPGNFIVYDVGCPPHWKAARHLTPVEWLRKNDYKPWRYRGIVD